MLGLICFRHLRKKTPGLWPIAHSPSPIANRQSLLTRDAVFRVQKRGLCWNLHGRHMQTGSHGTMVFGVARLARWTSLFMTPAPGEVPVTAAPSGMGMALPLYLEKGDQMMLGAAGLGAQRQGCKVLRQSPTGARSAISPA